MARNLDASWKTGTMDFFVQPPPFNDQVHTFSKISALCQEPVSPQGVGSHSLEDLLCVGTSRGDVTAPAYGNAGPTDGCALAADDKAALLALLRAHREVVHAWPASFRASHRHAGAPCRHGRGVGHGAWMRRTQAVVVIPGARTSGVHVQPWSRPW